MTRIATVPAVAALGLALVVALAPVPLSGQALGAVTGTVVDRDSGRPLASVRVRVADGEGEAVTDVSGAFRITGVRAGERLLRAEAFGYRPMERRVLVTRDAPARLELTLEPQHLGLEGIVVTGTAAGSEARKVSHSVGSIDVSEIETPIPSVDQLLMGRLPGVVVQQSSGMAGSGRQIRLRGNVSAALSNEPLVYVDGIRIRSDGYPENMANNGDPLLGSNDTPSPLNDIHPADIERVEVVKGPAATTLYGAEAASGVLQIFTRRGELGRPVWTLDVAQGFGRVLRFGTPDDPYLGMEPWLDRAAWRQNYSLSVAGGGRLRYYASSSFTRNDGVLPSDTEDRLTVRANVDGEPREDLSLRFSSSHTVHDIENTPSGNSRSSLTFNVYRNPFNFVGDTTRATLDRLLDYRLTTALRHSIVSLTAVHTPTSAWTNRVTVGYDRTAARMEQLMPVGYIVVPDGSASREDWANGILTAEYVGSLDLDVASEVTASVAWGAQSVTSTVTSDQRYVAGFDAGETPRLDGGRVTIASDSEVRVRTTGAFAEAVLGLRDRYYLTAGLRVDGSTAFGDELGLQSYPRVGLSYVLSEEAFWPERLGRLKIRASYGHAGRAPGVVDALRTWNVTDFRGEDAILPGAVGNPELAPERTAELEVGAEASLLDERLSAEVTYYRQRTTDALFPVSPTPSEGFLETQLMNVGTLENRGVEVTVRGNLFSSSVMAWDAEAYVATNHAELTDVGGAPPLRIFDAGFMMQGAPVPTFVGPKVLNPDEIADPVIDEDHVWGSSLPETVVGLGTTLRLPGSIELSARGEFMGGHVVYDNIGNSQARRAVYAPCNPAYDLIEGGRAGELTAWQRVWCIPENVPNDGGPLYPGDFFRLREVSFRAPVPRALVGGAAHATVVLSAQNVWTWTNDDFLQFDPEMVGAEGMHTVVRRIDPHVPAPATFTVSVRVTR